MSSKVKEAVSFFQQGYNCAQALLAAYAEQFGLDRETALKIACGFGGGMHIGQTCGAVTGAFMVIGLKYGAAVPDMNARKNTYELVQKFTEKFKARNGSVSCRELLGCDVSTPQGIKTAKERGLFSSICPKIIQDSAEILEEILRQQK
jgi:C_GCAxxG_C_C family probable redox protein